MRSLHRHGTDPTIVRWIRATLEGRLAMAALGDATRSVGVSRGCPQGGVLSPLLWCLVVDHLLVRLNEGSVYAQGYADDMSSRGGKIPQHGIRAYKVGPTYRRRVVWRSWSVG